MTYIKTPYLKHEECTIEAVQTARLLCNLSLPVANLYIICTFSLRYERA